MHKYPNVTTNLVKLLRCETIIGGIIVSPGVILKVFNYLSLSVIEDMKCSWIEGKKTLNHARKNHSKVILIKTNYVFTKEFRQVLLYW